MKQTPPNKFAIEDLARLVNGNEQIEVVLANPGKWINWESPLTLSMVDILVVGVDLNAKWPLSIAFNTPNSEWQTIEYDPEMRFVLRLCDKPSD